MPQCLGLPGWWGERWLSFPPLGAFRGSCDLCLLRAVRGTVEGDGLEGAGFVKSP